MIGHKGITFYLLYAICILFLIASCGKKGDLTLKSYEKPDPPSGLRAIHRDSEIILFWDFPKDKEPSIKGFYLLKIVPPTPPLQKVSRGDFEKIAFVENNIRSYTDKNFKTCSEYRDKIISQNLRDILSNDSNIITVLPGTIPSPPEKISFKVELESIELTWESAGDRILYNIYKSDKEGLYSLMPVNEKPVSSTSFIDNLNIEKPVYYTIRSLLGTDIRDEGPASEEIVIDPMEFVPYPPEGLQSVVTKDNVYLIWKEVPEIWVIGYKVYREINKKDGFILIGETQIPTFLDKEKPITKRNYRVTSLSRTKESSPAEIRNIIFVPHRR
jgi:predicted small lipoprotein YifL